MNPAEFWSLIEQARDSVKRTTEIPQWIQTYLQRQPVQFIGEFELEFRRLSQLSYDARLWAAASLIMKFCSDDKFTDFRAWLIAKGKTVFENALHNPDSLAGVEIDGDHGMPILFRMNYVAETAYRAKVGELKDITDIIPRSSKLVLLNQDAFNGDQSKLPVMFPNLHSKIVK